MKILDAIKAEIRKAAADAMAEQELATKEQDRIIAQVGFQSMIVALTIIEKHEAANAKIRPATPEGQPGGKE